LSSSPENPFLDKNWRDHIAPVVDPTSETREEA
jgi:hypothetical protein